MQLLDYLKKSEGHIKSAYSKEVALELERASLDHFTKGCLEGMACCARDGDEVSYLTFATQDKSPNEALILQAIFVDEYRKPESAIHPESLGFFVSRIQVLDPDFYDRLIEPALLGNERIACYERVASRVRAGDTASARDRLMEFIGLFPMHVGLQISDYVSQECASMAYYAALENDEKVLDFFAKQRHGPGEARILQQLISTHGRISNLPLPHELFCRLVDRLDALAPDLLLDTFAREGSRLFKLLNQEEACHA